MAAAEVPWAIIKSGVKTNRARNDRDVPIIFIGDKASVFLSTVGISLPLFLNNHLVGNGDGFLLWLR